MLSAWSRYHMETFSALLAFCRNSPLTEEFPSQKSVTQSFDVFFDLRINTRLPYNRDAGDLRRHRSHYAITVISICILIVLHVNFLPHFPINAEKYMSSDEQAILVTSMGDLSEIFMCDTVTHDNYWRFTSRISKEI